MQEVYSLRNLSTKLCLDKFSLCAPRLLSLSILFALCFHEVKQYPIETPITNPLLYPINAIFQSNSLVEHYLEDESVGGDAS